MRGMLVSGMLLIVTSGYSGYSGFAAHGQVTEAPAAEVTASQRVAALVYLLGESCSPELAERARKAKRACALIELEINSDMHPDSSLPEGFAKRGYRAVTGYEPSPDGDPGKAVVIMTHPQTGRPMKSPAAGVVGGMTVIFYNTSNFSDHFEYKMTGLIYPAVCEASPEYCGMKRYNPQAFSLRRFSDNRVR